MPNTQFEFGKDREEKIDKFLDNLAWFHSSSPALNYTARSIEKLIDQIKILETVITKSSDESQNLSKALNRLTFYGVFVASTAVFITLLQFLFENHIWPFTI